MTKLLANKVAVVTGGTSGIGLAAVQHFVAEGASVIIADIQDKLGDQISQDLGEQAAYLHVNVTQESDVAAAVDFAVETYGKLDIFFNNAGAQGDPSPIMEIESEGAGRTFELLSTSVLLGHKYAARQFVKQGTGGSIISTASSAGLEGGWSSVGYTAAKHAVVGVVRQAAAELARQGIRSNAIAPGVVMTPIMAKSYGVPLDQAEEFAEFLAERLGGTMPSGRVGFAPDIAKVAVFLASDLSAHVNGVTIPVDGGATAVTLSSFGQDIGLYVEQYWSQAGLRGGSREATSGVKEKT
ncbi:SDR family NAD(P)-dependent oxidoreductase [Pseudarthrobacter sp. IC2-21]|uniref:SDR family NAD(P)-dependent oxidoreductase n=1 Tax=Pseudarthrobacter sp. IC2-21 TaxID=3092262 RepID=UPI002A6B7EA7|nr:SDR family oxidoreductase [Pseudarthrobacter sp. IC2-21]